ncbi:MAG TPA: AzlC family ABC transporter permease [Tissierellaceae bacterium]|nr:AzlC family ABC transporter permease [Tissierellaceae bacterium]
MSIQNKNDIKQGIKSALPLMLGYVPVAIAFGILAKNISISFGETSLFSIIVFAGASQFMALDLIQGGVGAGGIILATFLLNLRHMVMSASLSTKLQHIKKSYLPLIAFGITDESFSVLSFTENELSLAFLLTVNICSYGSWVIGTILGYLVGEILPVSLQASLGIGLYGMFVALLFPQFKGKINNLFLSILSALIYIILFYSRLFTNGWDIIIGIILSSFIGVVFLNRKGDVK